MADNSGAPIIEICYSETMGFNADSVEWCPFPELSQFMTCATYHLNEEKNENQIQTRSGNISLYKLASKDIKEVNLLKVHVLDSGGVLDMKWCPKKMEDFALLGVAKSDGKLSLLKLNHQKPCLEQFATCNLAKNVKELVLSLDWKENENLSLIASDSSGNLNYCVVRESDITVLSDWKAHEYEAWIAAFNYSQSILYSGGDDCLFKGWDSRSSNPIFIKKHHTMGVTAVSHCKINEHLLISGSYDENVFLWDVRSMKNPVHDICLKGGIWRLKWHPTNPSYFLSASMHNGVHLVSLLDGKLKLEAHFDKHASMAYGVDWCYLPQQNCSAETKNMTVSKGFSENLVSSCSFYDKLLHVWKIKL